MHNRNFIVFITLFVLILIGGSIAAYLYTSPSNQAKNTVETFYDFEKEGNFSSSWKLFHPYMKERFDKGHYIQDRAHVFMNHFGVETFTYTLKSSVEKINSWKPDKEAKAIGPVYAVTVVQTFKGKYGHFSIQQKVFVKKEKKEWTILWDYNK
ncbi:hypothetical protein LCL89_11650 [Halobacillus yeomjeoni]|uniref:hypothetical protein n=1 Tax=Halobacillus yeomjeoni TaxID=311194 RepID=UPI001CD7F0F4|nr:hypothetical protein [Halobacillus yeomjeoni]MCA0984700.1 hypothetical protein [Halobacillus yeomjeoni]